MSDVLDKTPEADDKGLDDIIGNALKTYDEPAAEPVVEEAPEPAGQPREPNGRWKASEQSSSEETAVSPEGESSAEVRPAAAEPTPQQPEPVKADASVDGDRFRGWSKEDQAAFTKLPREAQDFVIARQAAERTYAQSRVAEYEDYHRQVQPLVQVAVDNIDYFRQLGRGPVDAIKGLVETEQTLRYGTWDQKMQMFDFLHKTYGVPWQQPEPEDPFNPMTPGAEGYSHVHDLRAANQRMQAELAAIKQRQEEAEREQAVSFVENYGQSKNPDGSLRYPYFDAVRGAMGQLISSGRARSMDEAYQIASKPLEDRVARELESRSSTSLAAQREAVEKAKRAAPVRTSGIAPGGSAKSKSLDDIIGEALAGYPSAS